MRINFYRAVGAFFVLTAVFALPVFAQMPNPKVKLTESPPSAKKITQPKTSQPAPPPAAETQTQTSEAWKYTPPSAGTRAKRFVGRVVGPFALASTALSAGVAHAGDEPEEWENDFKGYARRFGSSFGKNVIDETVTYTFDEAFRVDSTFYKKGKGTSVGKRFANAVISPFTARTRSGRRVPGIPRFLGNYSSSIIAYETWYPKRYNYKDGLRDGTISLGFNVVVNLFREFVLPSRKD